MVLAICFPKSLQHQNRQPRHSTGQVCWGGKRSCALRVLQSLPVPKLNYSRKVKALVDNGLMELGTFMMPTSFTIVNRPLVGEQHGASRGATRQPRAARQRNHDSEAALKNPTLSFLLKSLWEDGWTRGANCNLSTKSSVLRPCNGTVRHIQQALKSQKRGYTQPRKNRDTGTLASRGQALEGGNKDRAFFQKRGS